MFDRRNDLLVDEMTSTIARAEVDAAVARLKCGTAPGIDGVHPWMVKSGGDAMKSSLLLLMRQSWKQVRLPTIWAAADVRFIPKKTMPTNFGDLRPISLLPTVAKLMEAVVQARMARLAEEHAWVRPNQAGFRAGGSPRFADGAPAARAQCLGQR